jgi:hypothetical protein
MEFIRQMKREPLVTCSERGQSLVEAAFFLPILFLIMVGLIETSNAIMSYMRLSSAVQEGAQFGAACGTDDGIAEVIFDSTPLRDAVTPDNTDGYVVHAEVDDDGQVDGWRESHIYGNGPAESGLTPEEIEERLSRSQAQGVGGSGGRQGVLVIHVRHKPGSLLGFPGVSTVSQRVTLQASSVMPVSGSDSARKGSQWPQGCAAYPLALHASLLEGAYKGQLLEAIPNGTKEGNFGWLRWLESWPATTETLAKALRYPGTSQDPHIGYHGGEGVYVGDWVPEGNDPSGDESLVMAELGEYERGGRYIRAIVWDQYKNGRYNVSGFVVVQPLTYTADLQELTVRFSHLDNTCPSVAIRQRAVEATATPAAVSQPAPAVTPAQRTNRLGGWAIIFAVLVVVGTLFWVWPRRR